MPNIRIPLKVIVRILRGTDDPVSLINVPGPFQLVSRSRDHAGVDIHLANDLVVLRQVKAHLTLL